MKVATWNINGINSRLQHVLDWCEANQPDVLCLQELKCVDSKFPVQKLRAAGFPNIEFHGEKAYNGIAILSKHRIYDLQKNFPGDKDDAPRRLIGGTIGGVRLVNVYTPHGTAIGSDKFDFKLDWMKRLREYFDQNFYLEDNVLLVGDLNVAPHELDVWKPSLWKDKTHFSKPERDALLHVKRWGFVDVFRQLNDEAREYTWWSNFHHDFEKGRGLRIDHLWASPQLAELCTGCWIDKTPRGWDSPSDHAPVVATFLV